MRVEKIGLATLYLGDCREIAPTLERPAAVITDPPYGINYKCSAPRALDYGRIKNDDGMLDLSHLFTLADQLLIFGANNFPSILPNRGRWLCWDKRTIDGAADKMLGSPFELAWSNKKTGFDKIVRVLHGGVVNADGGSRYHPTQKPLALMRASIEWMLKEPETILDPYMGSGSTGVAAVQMRHPFIGIEMEPKYFDIACRRIEEAQRQGDLFRDAAE